VFDQGSLGSCTANGLCALISYLQPGFMGSRLFLYYNERSLEGTVEEDSGAYVIDGINSLVKNGICKESMWPYDISKYKVKPSDSCYQNALDHQALKVKNLQQDREIMKKSLANGIPFVVGIAVYESFMSASVAKTGIVPMPKYREQLLGGHLVTCVGYDDKKGLWILRNSWGVEWGDKGYFYLPYQYLLKSQLTSDLWCILKME
jgi:C1A family cysteine protease